LRLIVVQWLSLVEDDIIKLELIEPIDVLVDEDDGSKSLGLQRRTAIVVGAAADLEDPLRGRTGRRDTSVPARCSCLGRVHGLRELAHHLPTSHLSTGGDGQDLIESCARCGGKRSASLATREAAHVCAAFIGSEKEWIRQLIARRVVEHVSPLCLTGPDLGLI